MVKENIKKLQPSEWEHIFTNVIYDKGLVSKIHKECIYFKNKEINNQIKKWVKDMKRYFCKIIQMANRHKKDTQCN